MARAVDCEPAGIAEKDPFRTFASACFSKLTRKGKRACETKSGDRVAKLSTDPTESHLSHLIWVTKRLSH
jgi:hypothetical protein